MGNDTEPGMDTEFGADEGALAELMLILRPVERRFAVVFVVSLLGASAAALMLRLLHGAGVGPVVASWLLTLLLLLVVQRRLLIPSALRRARFALELWLARHQLNEHDLRRSLRSDERFRLLRAIPRTPTTLFPSEEERA